MPCMKGHKGNRGSPRALQETFCPESSPVKTPLPDLPEFADFEEFVLLRKEGFTASSSTVGRILKSFKTRGLLREGEKPRKVSVTGNRRGHQRPHAQRKPKDYEVESPGILPPSTLWTSVPSLERCISNLPPETLSRGGPTPPSIPGLRPTSPGCSSRNSSGSAPFRCGLFR